MHQIDQPSASSTPVIAEGAAKGASIQDVATKPAGRKREHILKIRLNKEEYRRLGGRATGLSTWARHVLLSAAAKRRTTTPESYELHAIVCSRLWLASVLDQLTGHNHDAVRGTEVLQQAAELIEARPEIFAEDRANAG